MKRSLGLVILYMGWSACLTQEQYSPIFDLIDIDAILKNPRLRNHYIHCLLNEGSCSPEALALRGLLPEIIKTQCRKCTEIQKRNALKVLNFLRVEKPQVWNKFVKKYDPTGQYLDKFEKHSKEEDDSSE